jgi:hypothetical protein
VDDNPELSRAGWIASNDNSERLTSERSPNLL